MVDVLDSDLSSELSHLGFKQLGPGDLLTINCDYNLNWTVQIPVTN